MPGAMPMPGPMPALLTFIIEGGGIAGGSTLAPALPRPDPEPMAFPMPLPMPEVVEKDFFSFAFLVSPPPQSSLRSVASVSWMPRSAKGFTLAAWSKRARQYRPTVEAIANNKPS